MSRKPAQADASNERRGILIAGLTAPLWLPDLARSATAEEPKPDPPRPTAKNVTMTIVYDNNPGREGLNSQWGFSCLVRGKEKTILFDTGGEGWVLMPNMRELKIDPKEIDAVVLSHIHWDHVGGLTTFARERTNIPVYVPTGFPPALHAHIRSLGAEPVETAESKVVCRGARTTGTLGQGAIEEHGLCVETAEGWVLITGCAHPGVDNLAAWAKKVTGGPLRLVMGGFHMIRQPKSRIDAVIDRFEQLGVQQSAPCHCSGDETRAQFKQRLEDRCDLAGVGSVFTVRSGEKAQPA
jgi:7,8-dihydropterin-6-yl-methyl-4-(beta-D-ribofuranosyl)aminobenzene 5'-phosphate synthase